MFTPHYLQSNGHGNATVKSVKKLIQKVAPSGNIDCEEFDRVSSNFTTPQIMLAVHQPRFSMAILFAPVSLLMPTLSRRSGRSEQGVVIDYETIRSVMAQASDLSHCSNLML